MKLIYKWKLNNQEYAYLTDKNGGDPFISDSVTLADENLISAKANEKFNTEAAYKDQYEFMADIVMSEKGMSMLNYKYYFNLNDTSCGLPVDMNIYKGEDGVGIADIKTVYTATGADVTFILTDGRTYHTLIRNGEDGKPGENGKIIYEGVEDEGDCDETVYTGSLTDEDIERLKNIILEEVNTIVDNCKTEVMDVIEGYHSGDGGNSEGGSTLYNGNCKITINFTYSGAYDITNIVYGGKTYVFKNGSTYTVASGTEVTLRVRGANMENPVAISANGTTKATYVENSAHCYTFKPYCENITIGVNIGNIGENITPSGGTEDDVTSGDTYTLTIQNSGFDNGISYYTTMYINGTNAAPSVKSSSTEPTGIYKIPKGASVILNIGTIPSGVTPSFLIDGVNRNPNINGSYTFTMSKDITAKYVFTKENKTCTVSWSGLSYNSGESIAILADQKDGNGYKVITSGTAVALGSYLKISLKYSGERKGSILVNGTKISTGNVDGDTHYGICKVYTNLTISGGIIDNSTTKYKISHTGETCGPFYCIWTYDGQSGSVTWGESYPKGATCRVHCSSATSGKIMTLYRDGSSVSLDSENNYTFTLNSDTSFHTTVESSGRSAALRASTADPNSTFTFSYRADGLADNESIEILKIDGSGNEILIGEETEFENGTVIRIYPLLGANRIANIIFNDGEAEKINGDYYQFTIIEDSTAILLISNSKASVPSKAPAKASASPTGRDYIYTLSGYVNITNATQAASTTYYEVEFSIPVISPNSYATSRVILAHTSDDLLNSLSVYFYDQDQSYELSGTTYFTSKGIHLFCSAGFTLSLGSTSTSSENIFKKDDVIFMPQANTVYKLVLDSANSSAKIYQSGTVVATATFNNNSSVTRKYLSPGGGYSCLSGEFGGWYGGSIYVHSFIYKSSGSVIYNLTPTKSGSNYYMHNSVDNNNYGYNLTQGYVASVDGSSGGGSSTSDCSFNYTTEGFTPYSGDTYDVKYIKAGETTKYTATTGSTIVCKSGTTVTITANVGDDKHSTRGVRVYFKNVLQSQSNTYSFNKTFTITTSADYFKIEFYDIEGSSSNSGNTSSNKYVDIIACYVGGNGGGGTTTIIYSGCTCNSGNTGNSSGNTCLCEFDGIKDAPLDHNIYARKDGAWIAIGDENGLIYNGTTGDDVVELTKHEFLFTYRVKYQEEGDTVSIKRLVSGTTYADCNSDDVYAENTKIFIKAYTSNAARSVYVKKNGNIITLNGDNIYSFNITEDTDISIYFDKADNVTTIFSQIIDINNSSNYVNTTNWANFNRLSAFKSNTQTGAYQFANRSKSIIEFAVKSLPTSSSVIYPYYISLNTGGEEYIGINSDGEIIVTCTYNHEYITQKRFTNKCAVNDKVKIVLDTFESKTAKLYINGIEKETLSDVKYGSNTPVYTTPTLHIGCKDNSMFSYEFATYNIDIYNYEIYCDGIKILHLRPWEDGIGSGHYCFKDIVSNVLIKGYDNSYSSSGLVISSVASSAREMADAGSEATEMNARSMSMSYFNDDTIDTGVTETDEIIISGLTYDENGNLIVNGDLYGSVTLSRGTTPKLTISMTEEGVPYIWASTWLSESEATTGQLYKDENGFLKVK